MIEKVGEAHVSGSANNLDIHVFDSDGAQVTLADVDLDFVRGHFVNLEEEDRLRATAFDRHKAGFEIASDELFIHSSGTIEDDYGYEVIEISVQDDRTLKPNILSHEPLEAAFSRRWMGTYHRKIAQPKEGFGQLVPPESPVKTENTTFVTHAVLSDMIALNRDDDGRSPPVERTRDFMLGRVHTDVSLTKANQLAEKISRDRELPGESNDVVADYIAAALS